MSTEIQVRIRHENDTAAVHFCTWDMARLDELIPLVERWGLAFRGDVNDWEIVGQFVLDHSGAYFEVIVSDPEMATS